MHTTAMCSPTRACLLTGRNPHTCGMGMISELASGFPGYDGMPKFTGTIDRVVVSVSGKPFEFASKEIERAFLIQ